MIVPDIYRVLGLFWPKNGCLREVAEIIPPGGPWPTHCPVCGDNLIRSGDYVRPPFGIVYLCPSHADKPGYVVWFSRESKVEFAEILLALGMPK